MQYLGAYSLTQKPHVKARRQVTEERVTWEKEQDLKNKNPIVDKNSRARFFE